MVMLVIGVVGGVVLAVMVPAVYNWVKSKIGG